MDVEKQIEEGARALQRVHHPDEHWDTYPEHWKALCRVRARAVIATTLKAAAEEASAMPATILVMHERGPNDPPGNFRRPTTIADFSNTLRALAEQVEKDNV